MAVVRLPSSSASDFRQSFEPTEFGHRVTVEGRKLGSIGSSWTLTEYTETAPTSQVEKVCHGAVETPVLVPPSSGVLFLGDPTQAGLGKGGVELLAICLKRLRSVLYQRRISEPVWRES